MISDESMPETTHDGPRFFHDGFYTTHEDVVEACQRLADEGWTIVAVLPPTRNDSLFSIVASHPTCELPSWEES